MGSGGHPVAGVDYPRNYHELLAWFPDDEACLRYLERLRWDDGFVCRFCGLVGGEYWLMGDGLRRCAACRRETSVTAGTILAKTRMPLVSWFAAIWYVVNQKNGVSALGLQRVLGFGSYQTAWSWLHKLRRAMVCPGRDPLTGAVEVDETIVGGVKPGAGKRSLHGKALVVIAVECHDGGPGRTRMHRIPNASADVLTDFVLDNVARGSEVRTDGWHGYDHIGRHRFTHAVTSLRASGDAAHVVMPEVHRSQACSSAGCWAPTKAPSATTSSTTTSTSSRFASTAGAHAIAACCSTACSNRPSGQAHTPTRRSKPKPRHDQTPPRTGVAKRIAHSWVIQRGSDGQRPASLSIARAISRAGE